MKLNVALLSILTVGVFAHTENDKNLEDSELSLPDLATLDALNPPSGYYIFPKL